MRRIVIWGEAARIERIGRRRPELQRRERLGLGGEQAGVLGDAHHGEDFGEVRREAEGVDLLAGVRRLNQHLDDERDAAGVDVVHFGEVQQDELGRLLGQRLVGCRAPRLSRCWRCRPQSGGR